MYDADVLSLTKTMSTSLWQYCTFSADNNNELTLYAEWSQFEQFCRFLAQLQYNLLLM